MKYILTVEFKDGKATPDLSYKADYNTHNYTVEQLEEIAREWQDEDADGTIYMVTGEYDDHDDLLETRVTMEDGSEIRYGNAAALMDSEILAEMVLDADLQDDGLLADPQAFLREYEKRHMQKFGEEFAV